jgi:SAM-dependent methyltransferase
VLASTPNQDKFNDHERYNQEAQNFLSSESTPALGPDGSLGVREELRAPYIYYENIIRATVEPGKRVLDLCSGNGVHTLTAARVGAHVTAADFAENTLAVVSLRAKRAGVSVITIVADAEKLPLPSHTFDLVSCAGGLSYVYLPRFLDEVIRVLKPGGVFVCVDSFDHNPIYRVNRYIHYLRGNRSFSTLQRMPNQHTLDAIRTHFPDLEVKYFGIGSFLMPAVRLVFGASKAVYFNNWIDSQFRFARKWAFKIVAYGHSKTAQAEIVG